MPTAACASIVRTRTPAWLPGLVVVLAFAVGGPACRDDGPDPVAGSDAVAAAARAAEVEQQLRALGQGMFEVVGCSPGSERVLQWRETDSAGNTFYTERRLVFFQVAFTADVRFTSDVRLPYKPVETKGEAALDADVVRQRAWRRLLFGGGARTRGQTQHIAGFAVFDALQPGWRFRSFDTATPTTLHPYAGARGGLR